jgi:predicted nucleic acid-binding protein
MPGQPSVFVDAPVLLCADDRRDAARQAQAARWLDALWARRCGALSTQVLHEYYVGATRPSLAHPLGPGDARAKVRRYQQWQPWQIDHQTVETAWGVEARHGTDYWTALVVAAAAHSGCRYLLTEALPHGQRMDAIQTVNPFLLSPEDLLAAAP